MHLCGWKWMSMVDKCHAMLKKNKCCFRRLARVECKLEVYCCCIPCIPNTQSPFSFCVASEHQLPAPGFAPLLSNSICRLWGFESCQHLSAVHSSSTESKRNRNFDLTQCVMADVTNAVGRPRQPSTSEELAETGGLERRGCPASCEPRSRSWMAVKHEIVVQHVLPKARTNRFRAQSVLWDPVRPSQKMSMDYLGAQNQSEKGL